MTSLLLMLSLALAPQALPASAKAVTVSPRPVAELDLSKLGGVVRYLTWNTDGTRLYLETADLKADGLPKEVFRYLVDPATGQTTTVAEEPAWSASYRGAMKFKSAPGDDGFQISLETEQRKATAVGTSMAGDYARGGTSADAGGMAGGVSMDTMSAAAQQTQSGTAHVMRLNGQIVGEWLNQPIVPGQSHGWGPAGSNLIAYAEPSNRQLVLMDKSGARKKIGDTKGVYSPAFSVDGRKLAWLEVKGKKATLVVADIH